MVLQPLLEHLKRLTIDELLETQTIFNFTMGLGSLKEDDGYRWPGGRYDPSTPLRATFGAFWTIGEVSSPIVAAQYGAGLKSVIPSLVGMVPLLAQLGWQYLKLRRQLKKQYNQYNADVPTSYKKQEF